MRNLGGWSISSLCYEFILSILQKNSIILELGSGLGTDYLTKNYVVFSIEHDPAWLNKYNSNYIHAPIKKYDDTWLPPNILKNSKYQLGWYDPFVLQTKMPQRYDLILVDGPPGRIGRGGFLKHLELFNTNVPIIFDDINRKEEYELMTKVSEKINKPWKKLDNYIGYII